MQLKKLGWDFALEAGGVDLAQPLSDGAFREIEEAFFAGQVLVFRAQNLTARQFLEFARRFGPPEPHVVDQFHHPVYAYILILANVVLDGKPAGLADAGTYFHTDYSYLEMPARATLLYSIQVPRAGGDTLFANQYAASGSSFGIEGMPDGEARVLLDELKRHATLEKYQVRLTYGAGDVVIWDNASLLHSATLTDPEDARTLWRITIMETRRQS